MSFKLFLGALVGQIGHATAGGFLASHLPLNIDRNISNPDYKKALFEELEEILGGELSDGTKQVVEHNEKLMGPAFHSLPKNANGKLDSAQVKYVLRRFFVQRHGWVLGGLEPTGEAWDPSNGTLILEDHAPETVQELFKKHIGPAGTGLHEIAVVAAMLEQLIFEDMLGKLLQAYQAKGYSFEQTVTRAQAEDLIALHIASFIRARDVSQWTPTQVAKFQKLIHVLYPNWKQTIQHMLEVQERMAPGLEDFTFDDVARVAAEIGSLFGHWQNQECETTKGHLVEMEEMNSGRVPLVDFYNAALHQGKHQFTETINYLRHLGTLDESDELNPRVIIPNYVIGKSNCVARTSYYSVCCLDACESFYGHIETNIGKPTASVDQITGVVAGLSGPEGGELTPLLRRRLNEIGQHHNGLVPLHGRLFAQWMHLAFPRDCAFPHKSGTVYYNSMEQWESETGERTGSTMKEIEHWSQHLGELSAARTVPEHSDDHDHLAGMWSMEEEIVSICRPGADCGKHGASHLHHPTEKKKDGASLMSYAPYFGGAFVLLLLTQCIPSSSSTKKRKSWLGGEDKWSV